MAEATDAARDRVVAARAVLATELETLEASARSAVDVPAKIKRSPAKAAAIAGGAAFLIGGGPKRLFRAGRRAVTGKPEPFPPSMLPDEVEATLRKLGTDGAKVRGALERDFAKYARAASKDRSGAQAALLMAAARPLLSNGAKAAAGWLFSGDEAGFQARLAQVRERLERGRGDDGRASTERDPAPSGGGDEPAREPDLGRG